MNRRSFFQRLIGAAAIISLAPRLCFGVPKETFLADAVLEEVNQYSIISLYAAGAAKEVNPHGIWREEQVSPVRLYHEEERARQSNTVYAHVVSHKDYEKVRSKK